MPEVVRPIGMLAEKAAWVWCASLGERSPTTEPLIEGENSADAIVLMLESRGWNSRIVQLSTADIDYLDASSLLQLADRTWVLFRSRIGQDVDLVTDEGRRRVSIEVLEGQLSGLGIELVQELPAGNLWRKVGASLLEWRGALMHVALASFMMMALALIPPQLTRLMIDRALPSGADSLLNLLALAVFLVALFRSWTGWLRSVAILYVKSRTEGRLNAGFLTHLLSLPFSFLNRKSQGELLQGFAGLRAAQDLLSERVLAAAFDGIAAILYLVVMFAMLPELTLAVLAAALIMGALAVLSGRVQARLQRKETEAQIRQRDYLLELISGAATIKSSGSEDQRLREWMHRFKRQLLIGLRRSRVALWSDGGIDLASQALTVVLLVWGARLALAGEFTVGGLLAFQQMGGAFLGSFMGLTGIYTTYAVLKPQLEAVTEALSIEPAPKRTRLQSKDLSGPVLLSSVWFRYEPHQPWILRDLSLEVQPGERRWIRGPSGFGKSTILRLIAGIYEPEQGTISIAGKTPADANDCMIYLPQFVQLYGTSILENLRIFSGGATRKRLMEAAEASGLYKLISSLPMGYETAMPSSGTTLSGGERQLVALTAIMASNRSLILLDEGLANVDWLSRFWIAHSSWFDGKTIIYASHDTAFGEDSKMSSLILIPRKKS